MSQKSKRPRASVVRRVRELQNEERALDRRSSLLRRRKGVVAFFIGGVSLVSMLIIGFIMAIGQVPVFTAAVVVGVSGVVTGLMSTVVMMLVLGAEATYEGSARAIKRRDILRERKEIVDAEGVHGELALARDVGEGGEVSIVDEQGGVSLIDE